MNNEKNQIKSMETSPHCSNCGVINPDIISLEGDGSGGLTDCCQETVCCRENWYRFANDSVSAEACCWAYAECQFKLQNIDLAKEYGMSRFPMDEF